MCLLISFSLPEADLMKQPFLAGLFCGCPGRSGLTFEDVENFLLMKFYVGLDHQPDDRGERVSALRKADLMN